MTSVWGMKRLKWFERLDLSKNFFGMHLESGCWCAAVQTLDLSLKGGGVFKYVSRLSKFTYRFESKSRLVRERHTTPVVAASVWGFFASGVLCGGYFCAEFYCGHFYTKAPEQCYSTLNWVDRVTQKWGEKVAVPVKRISRMQEEKTPAAPPDPLSTRHGVKPQARSVWHTRVCCSDRCTGYRWVPCFLPNANLMQIITRFYLFF